MKKLYIYLSAVLCMLLAFCGCSTGEIDEAAVSEATAIIEEIVDVGDLAESDSQMEAGFDLSEEKELIDDIIEESVDSEDADSEDIDSEEESSEPSDDDIAIVEDGTYTSKEEVALYIYTYGKLPSNFITKKEAEALGWESREGNLNEVAPGMSIGGDRYGNYEQLLPDGSYKECDINYHGGYRGDERLVYSEDGDIYYTDDHYGTFTQLYFSEDK